MELIYQVSNWDDTFEKAKSRTVDICSYVLLPNRQHGQGLLNVLYESDGLAIYGLWILLVGRLSRQKKPREGWLTDDGTDAGRPWTAIALARMYGCEKPIVDRLFQVLTSPNVGWLIAYYEKFEGTSRTLVELESPSISLNLPQSPTESLNLPQSPTESLNLPQSPTESLNLPQSPTVPQLPATGVNKNGSDAYENEPVTTQSPTESLNLPQSPTESLNLPQSPAISQGVPIKERNGKERNREESSHARAYAREPEKDDNPDMIQHAEAKLLFGAFVRDIFPAEIKKISGVLWAHDLEQKLYDALPIARQDFEDLNWAYRLPLSHPLFAVTRRKQSFGAVMDDLPRAIQNIKSARAQIGMTAGATARAKIAGDDWPTGARDAALALWGEKIDLPARYSDVPRSARAELEKALAAGATNGHGKK